MNPVTLTYNPVDRKYIEFGGKQAHFQVFLVASLDIVDFVCLRGQLDPGSYPIRLSAIGWCGSKVRVVWQQSRVVWR